MIKHPSRGSRLRWLAFLMGITILGITGFQLYWLKENYEREKKTLTIKSEVTFRQTMQELQVAKLNLKGFLIDSVHHGKTKVFITKDIGPGGKEVQIVAKNEIMSRINAIQQKLKDSLVKKPAEAGLIISMDNSVTWRSDTLKRTRRLPPPGMGKGDIFEVLYGVDSLQDSLKLRDIDDAYTAAMQTQKLNVPFTVVRLDSSTTFEPTFNEVTIGFTKPITYRLNLGNTFPYLVRRISLPILFSIILLGITILSFVLLYRTLLRQQRLAALKNEFISNITHELKTPIATVGVAIEALKNFNAIQDPERTKEYLDISSNELQRLGLLVDKVLKLSMFEKKEIDLKFEMTDLKKVVDEVVASLRLQLEKHHARVTVMAEGDTTLRADMLHLQSVVFNLLDNALKYGKKEPAIDILIKQDDDNIVLSITDNGIGIGPEYKNKIFDKFFRIPHGDTHNAKGYGLGLSYVAQVVQKHSGIITVDSQAGIGTKFTITLPKES